MNRSFFFEDQVYDWGRFQKTGQHTCAKITLKLPPSPQDCCTLSDKRCLSKACAFIEIQNYVIIASLKSDTMGKLMFVSFDIQFTRLGVENACCIDRPASQCQQAFSKPCQVNLISKETHLVFFIHRQLTLGSVRSSYNEICLLDLTRTKHETVAGKKTQLKKILPTDLPQNGRSHCAQTKYLLHFPLFL